MFKKMLRDLEGCLKSCWRGWGTGESGIEVGANGRTVPENYGENHNLPQRVDLSVVFMSIVTGEIVGGKRSQWGIF